MFTTVFKKTVAVNNTFIASTLSRSIRQFSKERAGKSIRPGCALIIDGQPHKCVKYGHGGTKLLNLILDPSHRFNNVYWQRMVVAKVLMYDMSD